MKNVFKLLIILLLASALTASATACFFGGRTSGDSDPSVRPSSDVAPDNGEPEATDDPSSIYEVPVIKVADIKNARYGDAVVFGKYDQDGDPSNGAEDLQWLVIGFDEGKVLVISRYVIFVSPLNKTMWEASTWEKSTLRQWLNGGFFTQTFDPGERAYILETEVVTNGKTTVDKLFLLSPEEVDKYLDDDDMKCCIFAEAVFKQDKDPADAKAWWWLRTPYDAYRVSIVEKDGRISGSYPFNEGGVRPAMWLSEG